MAATPIYGKNPLKILSRTRMVMTFRPTKFIQIMILQCRLTLTYLTSRLNLFPNAFKWGIFRKVDFLNTVKAKVIIGTPGFWGEWLFIFRELGSTGNYFQGFGEQAHSFGDLGSPAKK